MGIKISELPEATSANATDVLPIVQNNTTKKIAQGDLISAFTGTDGSVAGTKGLVPAPLATDDGKFLKANGTWATPSGRRRRRNKRLYRLNKQASNKWSNTYRQQVVK